MVGSHKKALRALTEIHGTGLLSKAAQMRKNDLTVYFALGLFSRRKAYAHLPESLKRNVKTFFGTYTNAVTYAKEQLYSVGNPELIEMRAVESNRILDIGRLEEGHSWTFHRLYLDDLPAELRIYVGCAAQLLGDIDESGKVSLMRYNDWDKDVPLLLERIKVRLRGQEVDLFIYGDKYPSEPLTFERGGG